MNMQHATLYPMLLLHAMVITIYAAFAIMKHIDTHNPMLSQ